MWGSLAAAFLAAGSSDVVATLFSVEDPTAAEFTALFYGAGGERDPVAATAAAQRTMATHLSASAWSAFTVVGL
jgi:CHAT domain-containing protein